MLVQNHHVFFSYNLKNFISDIALINFDEINNLFYLFDLGKISSAMIDSWKAIRGYSSKGLTRDQFNALLDHPSFRAMIDKNKSKINKMSSNQYVKAIRSAILTMALRNYKFSFCDKWYFFLIEWLLLRN
jgi:hypothetical protein